MKPIQRKKPQTLPEIRPNAGIERRYEKALLSVLKEIRSDVSETLVRGFKEQAEQEKLAMDGIADWTAHVIDYLLLRWQRKLEILAPQLAGLFVNRTVSHYESLMKTYLRRAGFTVRFQLTPFQTESLQAVTEGNVSLIKSIASRYLDQVQGHVWQCVTQGYDLKTLSENLRKEYGVTKRRAALIARDQASKAHAAIERAKRQELGITQAVWMHSHAGKVPRPSHLAADGKVFEVDKGLYLDGKWVLPGEEINCRCCSRSIIEGLE